MTKIKEDVALQQKLLQILERQALIRVMQRCDFIADNIRTTIIDVVVMSQVQPQLKTKRIYYVQYTADKDSTPKIFREVLDPQSQFVTILNNWSVTDTSWLTGASEVIRRSVVLGRSTEFTAISAANISLLPHYAKLELLLRQACFEKNDDEVNCLLGTILVRFRGFVEEQERYWRKLL